MRDVVTLTVQRPEEGIRADLVVPGRRVFTLRGNVDKLRSRLLAGQGVGALRIYFRNDMSPRVEYEAERQHTFISSGGVRGFVSARHNQRW